MAQTLKNHQDSDTSGFAQVIGRKSRAIVVIGKFLMEFKRPDKVDGIMFCVESFRCQAFDVPVDGSSASIRYHTCRNISLRGRRRRLLAQRNHRGWSTRERFLFAERGGRMLFIALVNL